jgi:carboxyl-terminal processing protease
MVPLPRELGGLKVTTALFFRPGGNSTQHEGVEADIVFPSLYSANELGEKHQEYSLPGQSIDSFIETSSTPPGDSSDPSFWQPVTPQLVAQLADLSRERVEKSEEFANIRQQIQETNDRNGVLHLSDIYKPPGSEDDDSADVQSDEAQSRRDEQASGGLPQDGAVASTTGDGDSSELAHAPTRASESSEEVDREEPSPQQREALQILADWVRLNG